MKKIITWVAVAAAGALAACQSTIARSDYETEHLRISTRGIKVAATRLRSSFAADSIDVHPQPDKRVCDVQVELVYDSNGNGIPGDEGDFRKKLAGLPGTFKGHSLRSVQAAVENRITRAYLVICGRPCNEKKKRVLATLEVSGHGVSPRGIETGGPALALAGGAECPHFVEMRVHDGRTLELTAGDLRAVSAPLRWLYAREGGLNGNADFAGAAVLANGHLLGWILGPNVGRVRVPLAKATIAKLRIVTVNRKLEIVGQWSVDGATIRV